MMNKQRKLSEIQQQDTSKTEQKSKIDLLKEKEAAEAKREAEKQVLREYVFEEIFQGAEDMVIELSDPEEDKDGKGGKGNQIFKGTNAFGDGKVKLEREAPSPLNKLSYMRFPSYTHDPKHGRNNYLDFQFRNYCYGSVKHGTTIKHKKKNHRKHIHS